MTFEEYISTETFRKERERLLIHKKHSKGRTIEFIAGLVLVLVSAILLPKEETGTLLWYEIVGFVLFGVGMVVVGISAFLSRKADDRREDSFMRRPAFAAAFLLYARQYLASGWRAENGIVRYDVDLPAAADKDVPSFALVRGGQRTEISFAPFGEHLDALDALVVTNFALFTWLENESVVAERISYRIVENGMQMLDKMGSGKGGDVVLYEAGKWKFAGRTQRREYRYIVKYARKKQLI